MSSSIVTYFYNGKLKLYIRLSKLYFGRWNFERQEMLTKTICSLSQIWSFEDLVFVMSTFGFSLWRLWAHLLYIQHIYTTVFSCLFFTLGIYIYTSKLYSDLQSVFIGFQWFSSVIYLAWACIDYLHLWYTHLQFMISEFQIVFCIIKFKSLTSMLS